MKKLLFVVALLNIVLNSCAQQPAAAYKKMEVMIPMRDGVKLFTAIYIPTETTEKYPFLIQRTPYSCAPYGENNLRSRLGPNSLFASEKYIYVYQDVRGRYMSEGNFKEMTPYIKNKKTNKETDESSDTYDTIDWLLKNIDNNNGNAGIYGISYPGFYATAALPDAHPALKAVSPQAPVTDEFEGDDAYHRGAFFLMDNFGFLNFFDHPRTGAIKQYPLVNSDINIEDAYSFYLTTGALKNFNERYFHNKSQIWNEYLQHNTKDEYWQQRNSRTSLFNIKPATLVVGGWFDAEDMFGALQTYQAIEQQNKNSNMLVMGPWTHGAWESKEWNHYAGYQFGANVNSYFQKMELDFFNFHLKNKGTINAGEANVFITGSNQWQSFSQWPPKEAKKQVWLLNKHHNLLLTKAVTRGRDVYESDPANPVPYINKKAGDRLNEYLGADQSFAAKRSDVVYYESAVLDKDITLCGPVIAKLFVSTTGTDADFVVKIIDVLPDEAHTQQLVRAEILRGKFRNSYEKPEPFTPGVITPVNLQLNATAHSFLKGHKIMIQIQSSWFPLVDRNPQQFMNIAEANDTDFKKASITIYHDAQHPSAIEVLEMP